MTAIAALLLVVPLAGRCDEVAFKEATAAYRAGLYEEAVRLFSRELMDRPGNQEARHFLMRSVQALAQRKQKPVEFVVTEPASEGAPSASLPGPSPAVLEIPRGEEVERVFQRGVGAYRARRLDEAVMDFRKVLLANPSHDRANAYLRLTQVLLAREESSEEGKIERKSGDQSLATKVFSPKAKVEKPPPPLPAPGQRREEIDSKTPVDSAGSLAHYRQGLLHYARGDLSKALELWSLSLKLDPGNEKARSAMERVQQESLLKNKR